MTRFGFPHRHLELTPSTNDVGRDLALAGTPSGTVVTAAEQSAGRGRRGRTWSAPAGTALLYSAVLRPLAPRHRLLPLAVPVAVCAAIDSAAQSRCRIKWPNDVWIGERKVAGVLIEARPPEWAVIGVGVNVAVGDAEFPADLRWPATSVGAGATVAQMRDALNEALGHWTQAEPAEILQAFRSRDALRGRTVSWASGEGAAAGITDDGDLLIDTGDDQVAVGAGEVQLEL
jgi:BirA family transcriptional regulator, biotin operon repressor / biotin---[acetyl-CoA-carboxylase] ligase